MQFSRWFQDFGHRGCKKIFNRYKRGLETCPQAKTSKSGHVIFFSFFRRVWATSMTQRRVENTRVHFWTFPPVSVNFEKLSMKLLITLSHPVLNSGWHWKTMVKFPLLKTETGLFIFIKTNLSEQTAPLYMFRQGRFVK